MNTAFIIDVFDNDKSDAIQRLSMITVHVECTLYGSMTVIL